MVNSEEVSKTSVDLKNLREDSQTSIKDVEEILFSVEYDLNELKNVENPRVLVLGTGPFFPEAQIVSKWAEENKKRTIVDCVDKEEIPEEYLKIILGFDTSTQYFRMNIVNSTFNDFPFDNKYDFVLILRYLDLSKVGDNVFSKIVNSLKNNGSLIMSGGINSNFQGYAFANSGLRPDKRASIYSPTDLYKAYSGENTAVKLRKYTDGI